MKKIIALSLFLTLAIISTVNAQQDSNGEKIKLTQSVSNLKPDKTVKPSKEDLISGNPEHRSWTLDNNENGVRFGIWEGTRGKWKFSIDNWEYCRILFGTSIITDENGKSFTVKEGDSFVLQPGFSGTWEAIETTRKEFIVK